VTQQFAHLHLHTEYSLVDSTIRIKKLVERVAALGMPAVAITDEYNLFAAVKFYRAAEKAGIKPIIGAEVLVHNPANPDAPFRQVLLCQDRAGYLNLCDLLSRAYLQGQYRGKPLLQREWISECSAGLIALSAGREGDIGQALLANHDNKANSLLAGWLEDFPGRYYLEIQRTGRAQEQYYEQGVLALARKTRCPVVATNDVRFLDSSDFRSHEARVCIHDGHLLADRRRTQRYSEEQYLRSPEEMRAAFRDLPEALENSWEIALRCNLGIEFGKNVLPAFPVPESDTEESYLQRQARAGLEQRLEAHGLADGHSREQYAKRLDLELAVINQMGYPGYFLIVADFIRWARENLIPVGPGRGSGAGSLVAWALAITDLDPLRYDLLFERFLNPERVSLPDFDIDFCMEQRDRVIDYVAETYGRDRVSQIITYGSMAAKGVIRDCGRVLGQGYGFVDSIAKLVPLTLGMTLTQALKEEPQLKKRYDEEDDTREILDLAMSLEGLARNAGKHAGGVVIAPSQLQDFAPLFCEPGGSSVVTQFDKDDVEAIGLVKFDFLGLRTLTVIDWALKTINRYREKNDLEALEIESIPLDDPATFKLLQASNTGAVFQLESRGMKDLIRRLQPDSFEDIIALVALFRPGPLQSGMVDDYITRKHGRTRVEYPHPKLEPILSPTHGVILYQEQVMESARELAGYSLGSADILRRAMGKKKPEEMAKQRQIFVTGATERDVTYEQANTIFDQMETFAGYGFNKSHSAGYGLIAYQTAYLKAHYPAAFMAAVLSADMDNTDKVGLMIDDCRLNSLLVEPPDINAGYYRFTVKDEATIRYGLGAIKGIGEAAIEAIIAALAELCNRIDLKKLNRRMFETLIRSGALDGLDPDKNRARLTQMVPKALQAAEQLHRDRDAGQSDMFGAVLNEWPDEHRLRGERAALGLYLTGHPVDAHRDTLSQFTSCKLKELAEKIKPPTDNGERNRRRDRGTPMVLAGMITQVRRRPGRGAFVTISDHDGSLDLSLFDEVYALYADYLVDDEIIVVEGNVSHDDFSGGQRMVARKLMTLAEAKSRFAKGVCINIHGPQDNIPTILESSWRAHLRPTATVQPKCG
jgi:DNA polymerase-3 subunit alpha